MWTATWKQNSRFQYKSGVVNVHICFYLAKFIFWSRFTFYKQMQTRIIIAIFVKGSRLKFKRGETKSKNYLGK